MGNQLVQPVRSDCSELQALHFFQFGYCLFSCESVGVVRLVDSIDVKLNHRYCVVLAMGGCETETTGAFCTQFLCRIYAPPFFFCFTKDGIGSILFRGRMEPMRESFGAATMWDALLYVWGVVIALWGRPNCSRKSSLSCQ
jgi:hypothetical protein